MVLSLLDDRKMLVPHAQNQNSGRAIISDKLWGITEKESGKQKDLSKGRLCRWLLEGFCLFYHSERVRSSRCLHDRLDKITSERALKPSKKHYLIERPGSGYV